MSMIKAGALKDGTVVHGSAFRSLQTVAGRKGTVMHGDSRWTWKQKRLGEERNEKRQKLSRQN